MARPRKPRITERDLQGFKYFDRLFPLLDRLHDVGAKRDKANNRQLFFDQYACLLLLYFFSPVLTSLRSLQQASGLDKVRKLLGVPRVSLGALSEAAHVFDPEPLRDIVRELAACAQPLQQGREAAALRGLTAVDGTFLAALPRMTWALWQDKQHAVKMHLQFDVFKGVPADAVITPGASSEPEQLLAMVQPGRLYVIDRGYASYGLFRSILEAHSSFVGRVKDNTAFHVAQERTIGPEAQAAGVVRDVVLDKLGAEKHKDVLCQNVRLVVVNGVDRTLGANGGNPDQAEGESELWLLTDRLDLPADLVALAYRFRWSVELYFRWLKCVLGCRHLVLESPHGVAIQCYAALIASLAMVVCTGCKPTKRTWEMIQFYLMGWASLEELERHVASLLASLKNAGQPTESARTA